jgi:hypothetical protein
MLVSFPIEDGRVAEKLGPAFAGPFEIEKSET